MPCFRLPYVGARVPSTSMYAIGPSNSRALPQSTALMHSINVNVLLSEAPAEVASRGRIRDQVRAQRIHDAVSWRKRSMSSSRGQRHHDQVAHGITQQGTKLPNTLVVGAIASADGYRAFVVLIRNPLTPIKVSLSGFLS